jgi:hypothetical protein
MKLTAKRPFANPEAAARKLLEPPVRQGQVATSEGWIRAGRLTLALLPRN